MNDLDLNALYKNPSPEESTHIDFAKTVNYVSAYTYLDMSIVKNGCPSSYQASNLLLRKTQLLYRNNDVSWIEAVADFEELHAECLLKDRKNAILFFSLLWIFLNGSAKALTIYNLSIRRMLNRSERRSFGEWIVCRKK